MCVKNRSRGIVQIKFMREKQQHTIVTNEIISFLENQNIFPNKIQDYE